MPVANSRKLNFRQSAPFRFPGAGMVRPFLEIETILQFIRAGLSVETLLMVRKTFPAECCLDERLQKGPLTGCLCRHFNCWTRGLLRARFPLTPGTPAPYSSS